MPTKASVSHPSQWVEEDIDVVCQTRYKTDLQRFQTYHRNKIDPGDMASINTKDHSAYIEVAWADPGSVIRKSVFSIAAYREVRHAFNHHIEGISPPVFQFLPLTSEGV